MYAHQVIEDTRSLLGQNIGKTPYINFLNKMQRDIASSVHFHIQDLSSSFDSLHIEGHKGMFLECGADLRLPFNNIWVDCDDNIAPSKDDLENPDRFLAQSRGMLVSMMREDLWTISVASKPKQGQALPSKWLFDPCFLALSIGRPLIEFPEMQKMVMPLFKSKPKVAKKLNMIPIPLIEDVQSSQQIIKSVLEGDSQRDIASLYTFLMLLSCRNIETIDNPPPEKLNKKRIKSGKQPIFTYKTLVIKPTGKQQKSVPKHLWDNRIHLCRGHFKTYTEDAPLFGKYTGRYWWQPSVRGNKNKGVVMKDYKLEAVGHA